MAGTIAKNCRVEVESTLDVAKTLTAITKANPGVASCPAHVFTNGQVVVLEPVAGMTELDGQIVEVANVTVNTFELRGIDTSNFGTFTSGSVRLISAWATLGEARTVNQGSVSPNRKDATVLLDTERQYLSGMPDTPEISIDTFSDPSTTAFAKVEAAARGGTNIGFRITLQNTGAKRIFRGEPTLPSESLSIDEIITGGFSVTQKRRRMYYAS